MPSSTEIIGIYRLPVTAELIEAQSEIGGDPAGAEAMLKQVVLIEVRLTGWTGKLDLCLFTQAGDQQVPWEERYLSDDGREIISIDDPPAGATDLRMAFWFHFFDPDVPLRTPCGDVGCPTVEDRMPDRLSRLMTYRPVD